MGCSVLEIVSDADREAVVAHRALAVALLDQIQAADVVAQSEVNAFPDDAGAQTHAQVGTFQPAFVSEDVALLVADLHFAADAEPFVPAMACGVEPMVRQGIIAQNVKVLDLQNVVI